MLGIKQHTIANSVHCKGVGLHSGRDVTMILHPAEVGTGIVFVRNDVDDSRNVIPASYRNVSCTRLCTKLTNSEGVEVATVEHVMAALWGCQIDNIIIELDGPEVPIMDGSSEPFVFLLECAGKQTQREVRQVIEVLKPVEVKEDGKFARVEPAGDFSVQLSIDYGDKIISTQRAHFSGTSFAFKNDLARARTFGFEHEVRQLQENGLALGGSLENAVVVGEDGILNDDGLRYDDEFVRHKILDCIGDFYLSGAYIQGAFSGHRTGHTLNNKLMHALFADPSAWRLVKPAVASFPLQPAMAH